MRVGAIRHLAPLAVVALFAASAVPALSSPGSTPGHAGISLRRVSMTPGVALSHKAQPSVPLRVADPAVYRREKAAAEAGYLEWLRSHPASGALARPTGVYNGLKHTGLDAAGQPESHTPPDTTGAAGPDDYVEMVNEEIAVYSKSDLSTPTETMDEPSFTGAPGQRVCDGNIEWDQEGGRWLYSAFGPCLSQQNGYSLYFGWSKTASPSLDASNWCQYAMDTGESVYDYPKLGHDDSQILIGVNDFSPNGLYSGIVVVDKPANGDTSCPDAGTEESTAALLTVGHGGSGAWTPVAANLADSSAVGYVVATDRATNKHLHLYTIGRDNTQANVLLGSRTITVRPYCVPPPVPQRKTKDTIESLDGRFTQAVAVTDPGTAQEAIWTQQTVGAGCRKNSPPYLAAGKGPSVVRWYELTPGAGTPTQAGTVRGPNGAFAFMGAISPSSDGQNAAIFYNTGSSTTVPALWVSDRHRYTTPGDMVEPLRLAGSRSADKDESCFPKAHYPCRWGDYNGASPDPANPSLVWGTGEIITLPPQLDQSPQWGSENAAMDVTPAASYSLQVNVKDVRAATGSVSSSPDGIAACTSTCSFDYAYNTPVELTATPGPHSIFWSWSGDCSGKNVCDVPMGGPQSVTALFIPEQELLRYAKLGNGSGRVNFLPGGAHCDSSCIQVVDYGTRVKVTATPAPGSVFKGWSGVCHGTGPCRVTMNAARRVKATFAK